MRVLFVNQFYLPDAVATAQILGDLAEGFAGVDGWSRQLIVQLLFLNDWQSD